MPTPKWFVVARNEYRISTSRMRVIRPYFPFLAVGLLAVYVVFVAPMIVGLFIDDFLAFIISEAAIPMMQITLFTFFLCFLLFPIGDTLREVQIEQLETFLAAPIKPSDLLVGEFLGRMPFYAIAITVVAGSFTALLDPLGLDMVQSVIIIAIFVITSLSSFWIGTVMAAILKTKLGKTARGKDIGRGLAVMIALPMVAVMYAIIGGGLREALVDPTTNGTIRVLLGLLPSSWGAEVLVGFASSPGGIGAFGFETLTRLGGLIIFFLALLPLGTRAVDRTCSLEPTSFTAPKVKPDGLFYKTVRFLGGGGSSGTLLASTLKDYGRRLENLSWLVYTLALIAFLSFFNISGLQSATSNWPGAPLKTLSLFTIPILSVFVVGTVSRGDEYILLLRKSPSGINKFIVAKLMHGCLVAVPVAALIVTSSTLLVPQFTAINLIANAVWTSLRTTAIVAFVLGLALLMPAFSHDSRTMVFVIMINAQIVMFATIGLEIGLTELGLRFSTIFPHVDKFTGLLCDYLLVTAIFLVLGVFLLTLGRINLDKIE